MISIPTQSIFVDQIKDFEERPPRYSKLNFQIPILN